MSNHRNTNKQFRIWEYEKQGDYHRNLDLDWSYAPTYLLKQKLVKNFLSSLQKDVQILDAGCGEGVLVDEYKSKGYQIVGIDKNYESPNVQIGDLRSLPYENNRFDVVLLLDVLEHFEYREQDIVLREIHRVLKPGGDFIVTVPNLTHLNSRFSVFFLGKLDWSDALTDHPGERSTRDNRMLLQNAGFRVQQCKGMTLSVPVVIKFIRHFPRQLLWLHNFLNLFALPSLAQFTYFECFKETG